MFPYPIEYFLHMHKQQYTSKEQDIILETKSLELNDCMVRLATISYIKLI